MKLLQLNTHAVALTGVALGMTSIIGGVLAAVRGFFAVAADPKELIALYQVASTHRDPTGALAQLIGAFIAVLGAFALLMVASLLLAYYGRPTVVAADPKPT